MGVFMKSGSGLMGTESAEMGVAVLAEVISEGKLLVMGVESFSSLGFGPGMMTTTTRTARNRTNLRAGRRTLVNSTGRHARRHSSRQVGGREAEQASKRQSDGDLQASRRASPQEQRLWADVEVGEE